MIPVGEFIEQRRGEILARCLGRAKALPVAKGLTQEELRDTLPGFIAALAAVLKGRDPDELEHVFDQHVSIRFRQGFGVEELVGEISLIGPCVFDEWSASRLDPQPTAEEVAAVFEAIRNVTVRSVSRLTRHLLEEEQTEKQYSRLLDRVATESFGEGPRSRPVFERLDEILRVICDAMDGQASWVLMRVSDSNLLEVKARAGALDDRILAYSTPVNAESIEGKIATRTAPQIVADLEQSPLDCSPALRESRIRSVIGMPIWSGARLLGVLLVGSGIIDRFSPRHAWRIETFAGRLALLLDQTELWQAVKTQAALVRENEERLRLAAAAAEIGVWELVPATGKLTWDARSKQFWGLPADAEVNLEVFLAGVHPDDRPRMSNVLKELVDHPPAAAFQFEYRTVGLQDGVQRWIATHGKVLFNDAGRADRFVGVMHDITSSKRVDELRDRLFGIVGHDLRNPLSAIKMATSLLKDQVSATQLKTVMIISRCADRMNRMIHDLMDFTRVRFAAGVPLRPEPVNLATLCREVVGEAELANPERQFRLSLSGDCSGTWDPSRLSEGLSNLIGNAVQHGAKETPIEVRVRGEGPEVLVEVHNEGIPIPDDVIPTVFDPFRSGSVASSGTGLGLGLYIVREIVAAHGGEIEVRSTRDTGTTFSVRLPRTPPPEAFAHAGSLGTDAPTSLTH